jgi:hypothetical protein
MWMLAVQDWFRSLALAAVLLGLVVAVVLAVAVTAAVIVRRLRRENPSP